MYIILKLNTTTKKWEKVHNSDCNKFSDAVSYISFETVQRIFLNRQTYSKKDFLEMPKWTTLLLKKDFNKVYITKNNNIYKVVKKED